MFAERSQQSAQLELPRSIRKSLMGEPFSRFQSSATPLRDIWQGEQIQTREKL